MSKAKQPSIDWPPQDIVRVTVGFDDLDKNTEYFNQSGYITILTLPNTREEVKGNRSEK